PVNSRTTTYRAEGESSAAPRPCATRPPSRTAATLGQPGQQRPGGEDEQPGIDDRFGAEQIGAVPTQEHQTGAHILVVGPVLLRLARHAEAFCPDAVAVG